MEEDRNSAVPAGEAEARRLTGELRAAIEEVRSAVLVLAARVRATHRARVWTALGYTGWAAYAGAEFGVSRSTAYRLLDLAAAAEAIEDVVARQVGPELSHAWDTGLVLPVRAVVELKGRIAELTGLIAERLADAQAEAGGAPLEPGLVGEIVVGAVAELRERPEVPVAELERGPGPDGWPGEAWRALVARGAAWHGSGWTRTANSGCSPYRSCPGTSPSGTPRRSCTSWARRSAAPPRSCSRAACTC
ncbi:hypothetical protein [Kitasatospora sp. NPDC093102]|uniref:hypothetical protein n=1 Tax=Kitasatospora sp. NPDC093102 TaxID=3155069 RepID=UPI00341782FE